MSSAPSSADLETLTAEVEMAVARMRGHRRTCTLCEALSGAGVGFCSRLLVLSMRLARRKRALAAAQRPLQSR